MLRPSRQRKTPGRMACRKTLSPSGHCYGRFSDGAHLAVLGGRAENRNSLTRPVEVMVNERSFRRHQRFRGRVEGAEGPGSGVVFITGPKGSTGGRSQWLVESAGCVMKKSPSTLVERSSRLHQRNTAATSRSRRSPIHCQHRPRRTATYRCRRWERWFRWQALHLSTLVCHSSPALAW